MKRYSITLCALALCALTPYHAAAQLTAEMDQPYQLDVVLRVAPHPLLTAVFKENLRRELKDSLQQALGKVALVSVVDRHPLLAEVEKLGLQQGLDGTKERKPSKTHFVLVDFVDGQSYEVAARQHDGSTGLPAPAVRKARTADRQVVGQLAARLVLRDFGPVGTVIDRKNLETIQVALKASKLGDLAVHKGDLFALAELTAAGGRQVPYALLQVVEEPNAGMATCRLLAPSAQLREPPGLDGYRCLKLATTEAPLRLRFLDAKGQPLDQLQVHASRQGFDPARSKFEYLGSTDREGSLQSANPFANLAFLRVLQRGEARFQVPVAILDDRVAVFRIALDDSGDLAARFRLQKKGIDELMSVSLLVYNELVRSLNDQIGQGKHEQALQQAKEGLKVLQRDLPEFRKELDRLTADVTRSPLPAKDRDRILDETSYRQLDVARQRLDSFVQDQQTLVAQKTAKKDQEASVQAKFNQAQLHVNQADYDQAIKSYEEALALAGGKHPLIEKHLASLRTGWKVKNKEHQQAREFIYNHWAKFNQAEVLKEQVEGARLACAVCQKAGDVLTLNKFLAVFPEQWKKMEQFLASIRRDSAEGVKKYEVFEEAAESFLKLHREVIQFVEGKEKSGG